jgi:CHAT domain-containing protein
MLILPNILFFSVANAMQSQSIVQLYHNGKHQEALNLALDYLKESENKQDKENILSALKVLAYIYNQDNNNSKLVPIQEKIVALSKRLFIPQSTNIIDSEEVLALAYAKVGKYSQSESIQNEVLTKKMALFGKNSLNIINSLNNLTIIYQQQKKSEHNNNYSKQEITYKKIIEILESQTHKDFKSLYFYRNSLLSLYETANWDDKYDSYSTEVLNFKDIAEGSNDRIIANTIENIAHHYFFRSQFEKAKSLFLVLLDIQKNRLQSSNKEILKTLDSLARIYYYEKNYSDAKKIAVESLSLQENEFSEYNQLIPKTLDLLGDISFYSGDKSSAEYYYVRSYEIRKAILSEHHPDIALSYSNFARLYSGTTRAIDLYKKSIAVQKSNKSELGSYLDDDLSTILYDNQLHLYTLDKKRLENILKSRKKILGEANLYTENTLNKLAFIAFLEHLPDEGWHKFQQAQANRYHVLLQLLINEGSIGQRQTLKNYITAQDIYLSALRLDPNYLKICYELLLSQKGMLQRIQQQQHSIRVFAGQHHEYDAMLQSYKTLQNTILGHSFEIDVEAQKQTAKQAQLLEEYLIKDITHKYPFLFKLKPPTLKQIQNLLQPDEVLVDVYYNPIIDFKSRTHNKNYGWTAFIVDKNNLQVEFFDLLLSVGDSYIPIESKLVQQFTNSFQNYISGKQRIYVSLDGPLNNIALETIYNSKQKQYIMDSHEIIYLTSTWDFIRSKHTSNLKQKNNQIVVFAAPNYALDQPKYQEYLHDAHLPIPTQTAVTHQPTYWDFLDASIDEAKSIISINPKASMFLVNKALEEQFQALDNHAPSILHISTHGFFNNSDGMNESGFVLAGANTAQGSVLNERSDGYITASEVAVMNLDGNDLAVLSTCNSANGEPLPGDGVAGLRRAFLLGGTRTIIASVNPVPDKSTAQFMKAFYYYLLAKKQSKIKSLNLARIAVRDSNPELAKDLNDQWYSVPHREIKDWGNFILLGDPE